MITFKLTTTLSKVQVCFIVFIGSWLCAIGFIVLVEVEAIRGLSQPIGRLIGVFIASASVWFSCALYLWSLRQETSYSKDILDDAIAEELHYARVLQESKDRLAATKAFHEQRIAAIKAHYAQK